LRAAPAPSVAESMGMCGAGDTVGLASVR